MIDTRVYPQLVNKRNIPYRPQQGPARSVLEGARNCACAGGACLVHIGLGLASEALPPSHLDFRKAAGDPRDNNGNPRGLASAETEHALGVLGVPRDATARRYYGESHGTAWTLLTTGYALGAAGRYGYINNRYPQVSGDLNFDGNHFVVFVNPIAHDPAFNGNRSVEMREGLQDGRTRDGHKYPEGPQRIPWWVARGFMERLLVGPTGGEHPIGKGLGVFMAVAIVESTAAKIARLEAELDAQLAIASDQARSFDDRNAALAAADDLLAEIEEVTP